MRVKHGTKFRVRVSGGHSCAPRGCRHDDMVDAGLLDAHLTVMSAVHGFVSGLCAGDGSKVRITIDDRANILRGDEECDCKTCVA